MFIHPRDGKVLRLFHFAKKPKKEIARQMSEQHDKSKMISISRPVTEKPRGFVCFMMR